MNRLLLLWGVLAGLTSSNGGVITIRIDSQERFASIPQILQSCLNSQPQEITFQFEPGTYFFDERILRLDGIQAPGTSIRFIGNGATLTARGEDYADGSPLTSTLDAGTGILSDGNDVFAWSPVFHADSQVRTQDKDRHLFRLKCKSLSPASVGDISQCYILVTQWYKSRMMKVHSIEEGAVTFYAEEGAEDLNMDFDYARRFPRFKLLNMKDAPICVQDGVIRLKEGVDSIHLCQAGRLLTAYGAAFKSISFQDFRFVGNRDNVYALMDFTNTQTEGITITDCEFCGIHSNLIQVAFSPFFTFSGNHIHDCYRGGVNSFAAPGTHISNNIFHHVGLAMTNDFCIGCAGEDYLVRGNKISDFGYGGIAIGMHYRQERSCKITGTVEYNELWYTSSYMDAYQDYTLMDSGAIYVFTQNDKTHIRNNYIHDYIGMKDNRGIFLDDGASHVTVSSNVIQRTPNSWSIDSRLVPEVVTMPGSQVKEANVGVLILGNKVDGKIRFEKNLRQ